ncbi:DUF262 domain-containing HNH endonuclease family protein [Fluviicola sp.]|uniref:DUF262 domain-containing protein n=1 Tax=Fluviicola sp. TaxID=1917219 RepID=UPI0031CF3A07
MAELNVSRKDIRKLFTDMQGKKFIIPEYQRPYKWNIEKCETLWQDILDFYESDTSQKQEYYLGTIVSYKSEDNDKEVDIIDGQQRITSFFLLLRAFYTRLEQMTSDPRVNGLMGQIAPCIWDVDSISQLVEDKKKTHIESKVATDDDNHTFHTILETGHLSHVKKDRYSINYNFFLTKCQEYASLNPIKWQELCVTILQRCIILPIECDTPDTALRIFSTLNDRGMPLADSDIFKSEIYKSKPSSDEKYAFNEKWKDLTEVCKKSDLTIDDIFRYYSHYIRAVNGDKSKEIALRKFYQTGGIKNEKLHHPDLMPNIIDLSLFWLYINKNEKHESISVDFNIYTWKQLQILSTYPNEYWKYIVSVYYLINRSTSTFNDNFPKFLENLQAFLLVRFIENPSVNAIKDSIYQHCIYIANSQDHSFTREINDDQLRERLPIYSYSRITRSLLLLHAYQNKHQMDLIPNGHDIEHIFPKKWQNTNYNGWEQIDAKNYLEKFGNKILFEKRLNIQAGNGYFNAKKTHYSKSNIANVVELANHKNTDWVKEDIIEREERLISDLISYFKKVLN